jgi:adenylyltransferase/sulfurtransferase
MFLGDIHIVDYDEVELSNLHRQILHHEGDIGVLKVHSASDKLRDINSNINVVPHHIHASSSIVELITKHAYDVVLDCSDNAPTRYLLNDICVIHNIPLVSGSALQMEGQLTVYHYKNGPCYRCLFPTPPPPHTVTNCGDGGVLGAVAGVVGVLQALETVKILTEMDGVLSGRLLLFDGSGTNFRNVKLRQRVAECAVCGDNPTITTPIDYEQFCGSKAHDKVRSWRRFFRHLSPSRL